MTCPYPQHVCVVLGVLKIDGHLDDPLKVVALRHRLLYQGPVMEACEDDHPIEVVTCNGVSLSSEVLLLFHVAEELHEAPSSGGR